MPRACYEWDISTLFPGQEPPNHPRQTRCLKARTKTHFNARKTPNNPKPVLSPPQTKKLVFLPSYRVDLLLSPEQILISHPPSVLASCFFHHPTVKKGEKTWRKKGGPGGSVRDRSPGPCGSIRWIQAASREGAGAAARLRRGDAPSAGAHRWPSGSSFQRKGFWAKGFWLLVGCVCFFFLLASLFLVACFLVSTSGCGSKLNS